MNTVHIAGHLGKDPETRFTPDGTKVTSFSVATKVRRGGQDETIWWRVSVWGDRYDKLMPYLKKGSAVMVVGELTRAETYNDRDGKPQVSLELRAEIIRFSPFGKPEARDGQAGISQGAAPVSQDSYGAAAAQPVQYARAQTTNGQAALHNDAAEEDLPF